MKEAGIGEFQDKVAEILIRHRSILDCLSKFQESTSRISRALTKTVTGCGCIKIEAGKQVIPEHISLAECLKYVQSHLKGDFCENCREIVEEEIGNHLFYLVALCHLLDVDIEATLKKEFNKITALGYFNLT